MVLFISHCNILLCMIGQLDTKIVEKRNFLGSTYAKETVLALTGHTEKGTAASANLDSGVIPTFMIVKILTNAWKRTRVRVGNQQFVSTQKEIILANAHKATAVAIVKT